MGQVFGRGFDSRQVHFSMKVWRLQNNGIVSRKMRCNAIIFWIISLPPNGMHKTKNSEILANIDFTKISEKKIMPQTGIEPFYLISNTDRKGLWRLHHGCGVQKVFKRLLHTNRNWDFIYSKGFNNCYILLSNISQALENTKFVAGELSLIVSLVLYCPMSFYELW